jgi:ATP-grasp domain
MSNTVLITGARAIAALDIARDFKRAGYHVHMADSAGGASARLSHYVDGVHQIASPRDDFAGFSKDLAALVETLSPSLLIPTCEEVFHLASLAPEHGARAILFAPSLKILRQLHDKATFAAICDSLTLPVPATHRLASARDVGRFASDSTKWVFKPCFSRFGTHTLVGPTTQALSALAPSSSVPWVAQERIFGDEICFQAIAHNGVLSAFVAYRGTWQLKSGASLGFEALSLPDIQPLYDIAARLAAGLGLTGQFGCDVLIDADGKPWLIECNPRATSGVHLWPQDGRLALAYVGADQPVLQPEHNGPRYLGPAMATLALRDALGSGRFADWRTVVRAGRDVVGIEGDLLPLFGAFADGLAFTAQGAARGVSATAATTLDIEWNGEAHDHPTT